MVQNIDSAQRRSFIDAIDQVRRELQAEPTFADGDKRELSELAEEAIAEIAKEQPNTRRLSLVLQSLAATVQGIASGGPAYAALAAAAAAIGIPI